MRVLTEKTPALLQKSLTGVWRRETSHTPTPLSRARSAAARAEPLDRGSAVCCTLGMGPGSPGPFEALQRHAGALAAAACPRSLRYAPPPAQRPEQRPAPRLVGHDRLQAQLLSQRHRITVAIAVAWSSAWNGHPTNVRRTGVVSTVQPSRTVPVRTSNQRTWFASSRWF